MTPVRFQQSYQGFDPRTIFAIDTRSKQLRPISSGEAYTGAGYQFGQETIADPNSYAGYGVGPAINRADELARLKEELNAYQNEQFSSGAPPAKRQSSTIEEQIATQDERINTSLAEFDALMKQYNELQQPNLFNEYTRLREEQGIPSLEGQFTDVRRQRRELPYVERARSGNAGVMTEGQLGAQTEQADIPLYIQEGNLIDRLKLAESFVSNALTFKESDFNRSQQGIITAAKLLSDTIGVMRQQKGDLLTQQSNNETKAKTARDFALANRITQPFFEIAGTIYRTTDGKAYSTPEQASADGVDMKGLTNVQKVTGTMGDVDFKQIGTDETTGAAVYGFVDTKNKTVTGIDGQQLSFNAGATGMRTDRHNNPTAMTTDVAKVLGLVEGQDYVAGDPFPDNPNLRTAKFLGDPVETTIKALDTAARDTSKQAFYTNGGKQRWTHTALSDQQWLAMTSDEKRRVVAQMYSKEGGNGSLVSGTQKAGQTVDGYDVSKFTPAYYNTKQGTQVRNDEQQSYNAWRANDIVKNYFTVQNKAMTVDRIIEAGVGGPGDLALVYEFMKALDPTSVVRETEYASAAKSGNIFAGAFARFNGYFKEEGGFLPENVKAAFADLINIKFEAATQQFVSFSNDTRRIAANQGLNPNNVTVGFEDAYKALRAADPFQQFIEEIQNMSPEEQYTAQLFGSSPSRNFTPVPSAGNYTPAPKYQSTKVDTFKSNVG